MGNLIIYSNNKNYTAKIATIFSSTTVTTTNTHSFANLKDLLETKSAGVFLIDLNDHRRSTLKYLYKFRKRNHKHKIILTSKQNELLARLDGYEAGADVYMDHKIDSRIIKSQINALLRRQTWDNQKYIAASKEQLTGKVYVGDSYVIISEQIIRLTPIELKIFKFLLDNMHRVVTKEDIVENVSDGKKYLAKYNYTLNVHLHNLKNKFAKVGISGIIKAIKGQEFKLELNNI